MNGKLLILVLLVVPALAQEPPRSALSLAAQYARYAADCADTVAVEQAQSFPIPVKTAQGLSYRLMYYPTIAADQSPGSPRRVYAPSAVAQFDGEGTGVTCRVPVALPAAEFGSPLGSEMAPRAAAMTAEEYSAGSEKLYLALESTANAFAAGRQDASARAAAADFQSLFTELSEPGLEAHYRALNPAFWTWLNALRKK